MRDGGDDPLVDKGDLIGALYQIAVNPLAYEALLTKWDVTIRGTLRADGGAEALDPDLVEHARRADAILSKLEATGLPDSPPSILGSIEADRNPVVVLSGGGRVLSANQAWQEAFDTGDPAGIEAFLARGAYAGEWCGLVRCLSDPPDTAARILGILQVEKPAGRGRALFVLYRASCPDDPRVEAILSALAPVWTTACIALLRGHFGLTEAETDIIKGLIDGANAQDIARSRRTSVQTVRTQIKSLLAKTGFESQIDLVRHLGFLHQVERPAGVPVSPGAAADSPAAGPGELHTFQRASGARLDYALIGPEDGAPVLYLHGVIDSAAMPARVHAQLQRHDIRLIAPVRPHFGTSDGYRDGETLEGVVIELLDALGIGRIPVIGHMAGALHACRLAVAFPERVSRIVSVAGAVPMIWPWQFTGMSTGHRIAGLTARNAPSILPLLIRGGVQLLRKDQGKFLLHLAFRDAPEDWHFVQSGEMRALMFERLRCVTAQGGRAFEMDVRAVSGDWSDLAARLACPLTLVHGRHDRVVLIEGVEAFSRRMNAALVIAESCGQLVWSQEPELVFDALAPGSGA